MEADIRKLSRRQRESDDEGDDQPSKKRTKSHLEEEMMKYSANRVVVRRDREGKRRAKDEGDLLAALESFRGKLQHARHEDDDQTMEQQEETKHVDPISAEAILPAAEDEGIEVDDDLGWLGHKLRFHKGNEVETQKADRDYEVIDPRVRGERARDEERERKRLSQQKQNRTVGQAFRRR